MTSTHRVLGALLLIAMRFCLSEQDNGQGERFIPSFTPIDRRTTTHSRTLTADGTIGTEELDSPSASGDVHSHRRERTADKVFTTDNGRLIKVFDNVLEFNLFSSLSEYIHLVAEWEFQNSGGSKDKGLSPWYASLDVEPFEHAAILPVMREILSAMDVNADSFKPFSITVHVLRRGDRINLMKDNEGSEKELSLLLYFNHYWRKNDYGELLFYEDSNDSFAVVSPKYNRVVVWDSSIGYILKPPSMDFKQGMMCLQMKFTSNETKISEAKQRRIEHMEEKMRARENIFADMTGSEIKTIHDVEKCLTKNYTTSEGRRLYVFDGLYNAADLEKLKDFVPKHGHFFFDDSLDLDSDNVQWIAGFPIDVYTQGKMWPVAQKVAAFVSGSEHWYPYDVSCNLLRTYDHTRIHEDCEALEKEWTFLVYLTPDWSEDKYGETNFLHFNSDHSEHLISVLPRFGRVVIFEGLIPHSGRPPSPSYDGARLTFVAKLSVNEWVGRVKSLKTEHGHEEGVHHQVLSLVKNYYDENYEANYQEMLLENAQELREMNSALNNRFKVSYPEGGWNYDQEEPEEDKEEEEDEEEDEEGEEEEEEEESNHDHDHHLLFDADEEELGGEYDERSHFDGEMLPEVEQRRRYIYSLFNDPTRDIERLRSHYAQFMMDQEEIRLKYQQQLEKLI